jgi:glyoxylase-like metal-dependent hydrolase (beta-lactamase superfamily II)
MPQVHVLRPGYAHWEPFAKQRAGGTISLVLDDVKMIVDTGTAIDRQVILDALTQHGLRREDIEYVVCTHGHSDHIGNNNLFPHATFIVGYDLSRGDEYAFIDYSQGAYRINDDIEILYTPGHTSEDISVLATTALGVVAIVGDLFENSQDMSDDSWITFSRDQERQSKNRDMIINLSDFIVPGHGDIFKTPKNVVNSHNIILRSSTIVEETSRRSIPTFGQDLQNTPLSEISQIIADAMRKVYSVSYLEEHRIKSMFRRLFAHYRSETPTDYGALYEILHKELEEFQADPARHTHGTILVTHHFETNRGDKPWVSLYVTRSTYYRHLREAYAAFAEHLRTKEIRLRESA